MNPRVAQIYAELSRLFAELAALGGQPEAPASPTATSSRPTARRRGPRVIALPANPPPVSELGRQRARSSLRRHGIPLAEEK